MKNGMKKTNLCQTLLNLSDLLDLSIGYIQHNKGQNDYDTLTAKKSISPGTNYRTKKNFEKNIYLIWFSNR